MTYSDWKSQFISCGPGGADAYLEKLSFALKQMVTVFSDADKPYSGMAPEQLETLINQMVIPKDGNGDITQSTLDAVNTVAKNAVMVQHPNCIAHLHTPPLLPALVAELILSALNQSMDSWDQASSATYLEQHMCNWVAQVFGFSEQGDATFTSGGTQSNQMGLLLARDAMIERFSGHHVQKQGLPDYFTKLRIICSQTSHFTVKKAAGQMGLGENAVVTVSSNRNGVIEPAALEQTLSNLKAQGLMPFAVVATAGTTDHGAIDPIETIADIAKKFELWLHVDAAYGSALQLSPYKSRLSGIEKADSVTVDFHKLFYQPISCGALLVKDKANFRFLLHRADYLNRETDTLPNLVDKSLSTTRRFDALKLFMTLRTLGENGLGNMVGKTVDLAQVAAALITETPALYLVATPQLSTVLFRVNLPSLDQEQRDQLHRTLRHQLLVKGVAVLGETVIEGEVTLKITILNPLLTQDDFTKLFAQIVAESRLLRCELIELAV